MMTVGWCGGCDVMVNICMGLYAINRSFIYVQEHLSVWLLVHSVLDREQASADLGQAQYEMV